MTALPYEKELAAEIERTQALLQDRKRIALASPAAVRAKKSMKKNICLATRKGPQRGQRGHDALKEMHWYNETLLGHIRAKWAIPFQTGHKQDKQDILLPVDESDMGRSHPATNREGGDKRRAKNQSSDSMGHLSDIFQVTGAKTS